MLRSERLSVFGGRAGGRDERRDEQRAGPGGQAPYWMLEAAVAAHDAVESVAVVAGRGWAMWDHLAKLLGRRSGIEQLKTALPKSTSPEARANAAAIFEYHAQRVAATTSLAKRGRRRSRPRPLAGVR